MLFLAFRLAMSQMLLFRHFPFKRAWASCTPKESGKSEVLPTASGRMLEICTSTEDESGVGPDSHGETPEEPWTRTPSSGNIGSAFLISRRPEQDDMISLQLRQTMFLLFQKSTLEPGGTLDRRRFEVFEAVQRASATSVWYTRWHSLNCLVFFC